MLLLCKARQSTYCCRVVLSVQGCSPGSAVSWGSPATTAAVDTDRKKRSGQVYIQAHGKQECVIHPGQARLCMSGTCDPEVPLDFLWSQQYKKIK